MDRQAILDEIERRELIATLQGGTESTDSVPTYRERTPRVYQSGAERSRAGSNEPSGNNWYDGPRSLLRGATMGLSDSIGAGLASLPANYGTGEPLGKTYDDIREALQYEEDLANEKDPTLANTEALGTAASLLTAGLPQAVGRGAAKVGGRVAGAAAKPSSAKAAATAAAKQGPKPRYVQRNGEWVLKEAAEEVPEKVTRLQGLKEGAMEGVGLDVAQAVFTGDHNPELTAGGAVAGLAFPKAARALNAFKGTAHEATASPLARQVMSRAAGKVFGQKVQPFAYTASHPATQRQFKRGTEGFNKWRDARKARALHIKETKRKAKEAKRILEEERRNAT